MRRLPLARPPRRTGRYVTKQLKKRPGDVVADLLDALDEAADRGYAAAGVPLRL